MKATARVQRQLKSTNLRLTSARKSLIEVLENRHLTFKEIYHELCLKGHKNMSTLYNNIDFFLQEGIIVELNIDGIKYYDISLDNPDHLAQNHLHIVFYNEKQNQPSIKEINDSSVFDFLKSHPALNQYPIDSIKILVTVKKTKKP